MTLCILIDRLSRPPRGGNRASTLQSIELDINIFMKILILDLNVVPLEKGTERRLSI